MKRICMLIAALGLLSGCTASADPQALETLEDVMATVGGVVQPEAEKTITFCWDGEYSDGSRTITLEWEEDGTLYYQLSDGVSGSVSGVSGAAAKSDTLLFSLNGDLLTVFGGDYTGNYERT